MKLIYIIAAVFILHFVDMPILAETADNEYSKLMVKFCAGNYNEIVSEIDAKTQESASVPINLLCLRARAMTESYREFVFVNELRGRTLTTAERRKLDELAIRCTRYYEYAFRALPSKYLQACLTAEWWSLLATDSMFRGDSPLLRQAMPKNLEPQRDLLRLKIKHQAELFHLTFSKCLNEIDSSQQWPAEEKSAFALALTNEFTEFSIIDIPDDVFHDVIKDLPLFVHDYMPTPQQFQQPVTYRNAMRWYLWNALVRMPVHPVEKQAVKRQVEQWAELLEHEINTSLQDTRLMLDTHQYAARFLSSYEGLHDNRFIPFFKRVLCDHEHKKAMIAINEQIQQTNGSWIEQKKRYKDEFNITIIEKLEKIQDKYAANIYFLFMNAYTSPWHPAVYGHIPGEKVVLSFGSMNEKLAWVFRIGQCVPYEVQQLPAPSTTTTQTSNHNE